MKTHKISDSDIQGLDYWIVASFGPASAHEADLPLEARVLLLHLLELPVQLPQLGLRQVYYFIGEFLSVLGGNLVGGLAGSGVLVQQLLVVGFQPDGLHGLVHAFAQRFSIGFDPNLAFIENLEFVLGLGYALILVLFFQFQGRRLVQAYAPL